MGQPSVQRVSVDDSLDQEISLAALDHPRLVGLHRFWKSKCGSRAMPSRADFRPEELQPFLGFIVLVDVETPRRFRFRLVGTEIVSSYGFEITGQYTDIVQPFSYRRMIERHYGQAADETRPMVHRMNFSEGARVHDLVRLTLPLSEDGVRVNMLMLASVFGPELIRFRERQRAAAAAGEGGADA